MSSAALDQLCRCHGVLPGYTDMWGKAYSSSDEARRAVLGAMGVAARTEDEVAASLLAYEREQWLSTLPPVCVVKQGRQPYSVSLSVRKSMLARGWSWRLIRESGAEQTGVFRPVELPVTDRADVDGEPYVRCGLALDLTLEQGYHRLDVDCPGADGCAAAMSFIVTPSRCYEPPVLRDGGRAWGIAAQLYALRSARNWGMGDFADLRRAIDFCAETGAATLLLNPLHALFPDSPDHASPYSPSSRTWLNALYIAVEETADFAECEIAQDMVAAPAFQHAMHARRGSRNVDYGAVAKAKFAVLECLYEHFRQRHLATDSARAHAFRAFQASRGEGLRIHALFEALQAHFHALDPGVWGWPAWPEPFRDPSSVEVAAFAEAHALRVDYHAYLQWLAAEQVEAVGRRSLERGLGVGLMLDLAIGVAEGGVATWAERSLYALAASTGAPPDEINRMGQDWGLPPWIPSRLRASAYAPFIELLRANMKAAGALRIDHVMGLRRLFWIARGRPVAEGSYVEYPFDELLGILALESQRNACLVVGEDLGTVPEEVRAALDPLLVLSTRLLYFERRPDGGLKAPGEYPANAMVAVTTHDLPTLAAFWSGEDLDLRARLQLIPDQEIGQRLRAHRDQDREDLLHMLRIREDLPRATAATKTMTKELAAAIYAHLASAPSKLILVQIEDAFGVEEQANLPGTVAPAYPCWRLKLPIDLEQWGQSTALNTLVGGVRRARAR